MKMDLQAMLDEHLWLAIAANYENGNYTGAIIDSWYHLAAFIKEKTGLEGDGASLIGQAFGGTSPKLKVSQLQTETDWDAQKGTETLLRGFYQGIRNPRSHQKFADSKDDADAIILFVNYLLKMIGASKGTFSKAAFLGRVFDSSFVESQRYADALVGEIPRRYQFDIMVEVYGKKEQGDPQKLSYFVKSLIQKFSEQDISRLAEVVSEDLNN